MSHQNLSPLKIILKQEKQFRNLRDLFFFNKSVSNPEFLVFFRIAVGILLGTHFLSIFEDFHLLYGMESLIPSDIQTVYTSHSILYYDQIIDWFTLLTGSKVSAILFFKICYLLLCAMIATGFFSRFSAFFLLLLQISLTRSGCYFSYGVDFFSSMSLMYLMLLPGDDYYSLRNLIWRIKNRFDLTPFRRLLQIHLSIAYFVSGFEKIIGYNWRNGESIWKAVHLPNFSNDFNIDFNFLGDYPYLVVFIGWMAIIIELCYPLFINIKKTRKLWLYLTISLHLGIALTLNLYFFSAMMICWNLTSYYFEDKKIQDYETVIS